MHSFHKGAKKTEVVMRSGAEGGTVGSGMHMGDVRADGEVNGYGNFVPIRGEENAGACMFGIQRAAREKLSGGLTIANAGVSCRGGDLVEICAGFAGHAKGSRS